MFDEATLRRKIKCLNEAVWEGHVTGPVVEDWLSCFSAVRPDGVDERLQMLYLLSNFLYFGVREIRELLAALFRDLYRYPIIEQIRRQAADSVDVTSIDAEFSNALRRTRFLGVGNPSESGPHLLYYFRQENGLPSHLFINIYELPGFAANSDQHGRANVDRYIFIDDLCATGDQAIGYSQNIVDRIFSEHPAAHVAYYPLFATESALRRTRADARFSEVASVVELDETFKCFSETSRFYSNTGAPIDREATRDICLSYGSLLLARHPLGYRDSQLALGFHHNTPDNTLPVFWQEPNDILPTWSPVFRRYHKI